MKKKSVFIAIVFLISGLIISSCLKEKKTYDTSFSQDHAYVENVFNNVSGMADEANEINSNRSSLELATSYYLSECTEVILDLSANPYLLSIDFGEENCLCNDGRYRRGKILTTFTGMYREPGTVITHTLENYFVDNDQVIGTMVITNTGINEQQHMQYDVVVNGEVHKANNGRTINWTSDRIHEWIEGRESIEIIDDVYLISGTASGESSDNVSQGGNTKLTNTWQMNTIDPLRVALNCKWICAGELSVNASGWDEAIIEYGTGDCDNEIFVIYNGKTYTVNLP
ncbi:MAG: hypothetical protein V2I62_04670 [Bacteroidales bacterium]|jgi:hypothetical protein|nr:hypothetical protein [Bacteroidales bacterium]